MSNISNPIEMSAQDFVSTVYNTSNKNLLFWDTSSLLEILRFPYRGGDLDTYKSLNRINGLIQAGDIYSLASSLTIKEWNDNEDNIKNDVQASLEKTGNYHRICIEVANEISGSVYSSESIHDKDLISNLGRLADDIISKTIFIKTEEIANIALERVRDKRPPSAKKPEFKDCAIWETVLKVSRDIYTIDKVNHQVFYSVNTEDFVDKSREPKIFYGVLLSEASLSMLQCSYRIIEVNAVL